MLGKTERQVSFSDYWLQGRIPESSYWHKMRKWAMENLKEEMFQPLFSYYGRPSILFLPRINVPKLLKLPDRLQVC